MTRCGVSCRMILGCLVWCCLTAPGYGEGSDAPAQVRPRVLERGTETSINPDRNR